MRRFPPLAAAAAVSLALLAACGGGGEAAGDVPGGTVAVGRLPGTLSTEPASSTTSATTAPASTATTSTVAPETSFVSVLGDVAGGVPPVASPTELVVDDTGRLRMAVPVGWADRDTRPSTLAGGSRAPYLAAARDLTRFLDGYDAPGMTAVVVATAPAAALDGYDFGADCVAAGRSTYHTERLAGVYEVWRNCAGTGASIITAAVRPVQAAVERTVLVLAQVIEPADIAALDVALDSLQVAPS